MLASITRIVPAAVRTERDPAQVQAVIGDRQAVALRRAGAGSPRGTRKSWNFRPLLYACCSA